MNKLLLTSVFLFSFASLSYAQLIGTDIKPGDPCTAAEEGHVARNASADRDISEITLICDGTAWQSATGSGLAALQGQDDTGPCTAEKAGLLRYRDSGDPPWEYCHGGTTSWLPFRLPQCQNDGTGECTLSALRSADDPQFKASSIRCGDNVLGVTGTYGSGSSVAFTFSDAANISLSALTTASAVTISGIPAGCPGEVSIAGQGSPQISINGGAWSTSGTITNGQTLAVRLTSSASFLTAHTATVSIGSTDDLWSVTTRAQDTAPDAFAFTDVTGQNLSTLVTSNSLILTGYDGPMNVSVSGDGSPQMSVNGGAWGMSGTIGPGQTLAVRTTSAASYDTLRTVTVTAGTATDSWSVRTKVQDTTPDTFTFTDVTNAELSTVITSNSLTPAGYDGPLSISVTGQGSPQISVNGGAWATNGTITSGQTLAVRLTSSALNETVHVATITIGGTSDSWSVRTKPNVVGCAPTNVSWFQEFYGYGCNGNANALNHGDCMWLNYESSPGVCTYGGGTCGQALVCCDNGSTQLTSNRTCRWIDGSGGG